MDISEWSPFSKWQSSYKLHGKDDSKWSIYEVIKQSTTKKFVLAYTFESFYFRIFPNKSKQILHVRKIWSADTKDCRGEYLDLKERRW
jgi:hypothetical protein